ncbi:LuxR C-terminal-related transcriptional regulator [Streptomyces sp. NPDC006692]|uniref:helix-turn-helix domain-containing protein n=1 Tax=unclassified Streptomyces TaxID=2593676 RepID=UPI003693CA62
MNAQPGQVTLGRPALSSKVTSAAAHLELTGRQQQMVAYVAMGKSTASIAKSCFLSEYTVKTHLRVARKKLGVSAAPALVNTAYETGAIPAPDPLGSTVVISGIEQQVLQLISLGYCYAEIASELDKKEGWVHEKARTLRRRLEARNGAHLMTRARQLGLLGARTQPTECHQHPQEIAMFAIQPPSPGWKASEPDEKPTDTDTERPQTSDEPTDADQ